MAGEIVFLSVVQFYCDVDDMLRRARDANSINLRLHGLGLARLRHARRMEPRLASQIYTTLLRIRVAVREVQLDYANWNCRVVMSYLRVCILDPLATAVIAPPPVRRQIGETDGQMNGMFANARLGVERARFRGLDLDIWDPPSETEEEDEGEEGGFDSDA